MFFVLNKIFIENFVKTFLKRSSYLILSHISGLGSWKFKLLYMWGSGSQQRQRQCLITFTINKWRKSLIKVLKFVTKTTRDPNKWIGFISTLSSIVNIRYMQTLNLHVKYWILILSIWTSCKAESTDLS